MKSLFSQLEYLSPKYTLHHLLIPPKGLKEDELSLDEKSLHSFNLHSLDTSHSDSTITNSLDSKNCVEDSLDGNHISHQCIEKNNEGAQNQSQSMAALPSNSVKQFAMLGQKMHKRACEECCQRLFTAFQGYFCCGNHNTPKPELMKIPIPALTLEQKPIYVNQKQYQRILIRRNKRMSEILKRSKKSIKKSYLHESRHKHASRRKRDSNGRFISKRLKNQVITHLGLEYERKEDEFTLQENSEENDLTTRSDLAELSNDFSVVEGSPRMSPLAFLERENAGLTIPGEMQLHEMISEKEVADVWNVFMRDKEKVV